MVSHKHALERAQKLRRHARTRGAKEIKRDETVQEIKTRGRALNPENHHLLGDLNVPLFRADTPSGRIKGSQLTDYRAIEKGVEKIELITKELNQ